MVDTRTERPTVDNRSSINRAGRSQGSSASANTLARGLGNLATSIVTGVQDRREEDAVAAAALKEKEDELFVLEHEAVNDVDQGLRRGALQSRQREEISAFQARSKLLDDPSLVEYGVIADRIKRAAKNKNELRARLNVLTQRSINQSPGLAAMFRKAHSEVLTDNAGIIDLAEDDIREAEEDTANQLASQEKYQQTLISDARAKGVMFFDPGTGQPHPSWKIEMNLEAVYRAQAEERDLQDAIATATRKARLDLGVGKVTQEAVEQDLVNAQNIVRSAFTNPARFTSIQMANYSKAYDSVNDIWSSEAPVSEKAADTQRALTTHLAAFSGPYGSIAGNPQYEAVLTQIKSIYNRAQELHDGSLDDAALVREGNVAKVMIEASVLSDPILAQAYALKFAGGDAFAAIVSDEANVEDVTRALGSLFTSAPLAPGGQTLSAVEFARSTARGTAPPEVKMRVGNAVVDNFNSTSPEDRAALLNVMSDPAAKQFNLSPDMSAKVSSVISQDMHATLGGILEDFDADSDTIEVTDKGLIFHGPNGRALNGLYGSRVNRGYTSLINTEGDAKAKKFLENTSEIIQSYAFSVREQKVQRREDQLALFNRIMAPKLKDSERARNSAIYREGNVVPSEHPNGIFQFTDIHGEVRVANIVDSKVVKVTRFKDEQASDGSTSDNGTP